MTSETKLDEQQQAAQQEQEAEEMLKQERTRLGYRRANQAALYAHLRTLLAATLVKNNPIIGLHGVLLHENGETMYTSAGGTPLTLAPLFSGLGALQGHLVDQIFARQRGGFKGALTGDTFDPKTGLTHCVACEDGDPSGNHAAHELEENARAWLGLLVEVALSFYGAHLPTQAGLLLDSLQQFTLAPDAKVG